MTQKFLLQVMQIYSVLGALMFLAYINNMIEDLKCIMKLLTHDTFFFASNFNIFCGHQLAS